MRTSSSGRYSRRTRVVGASTAAVVVLGAAGALALNATSASAELAPMSAQELLVAMHDAERSPLSGTVELSADLGLPDVRGLGDGATGPLALLAGNHQVRVWKGEKAQSRIDLVGDAREDRVTLNGSDLWVWSSQTKEARHYILPKHGQKHGGMRGKGGHAEMMKRHRGAAGEAPATPQEAADRVLEAIGDTTAVTTANTEVARRAAYSLVLTPKTQGTLVDRVELAVDGETKVPLRVQVFSTKMTNPAYSVGFSKVDFTAPDASVFSFTPPSGATVTTTDVAADMRQKRAEKGKLTEAEKATMRERHAAAMQDKKSKQDNTDAKNATGEGWARVYVADAPKDKDGKPVGNAADALLKQLEGDQAQAANNDTARTMTRLLEALPKRTVNGVTGTVFEGTLFTLVLADDGRVGLGAVPADTVFSALTK